MGFLSFSVLHRRSDCDVKGLLSFLLSLFLSYIQILTNAKETLTIVTLMLTAVTQMDHTCASANPDTPEMDVNVQVQQRSSDSDTMTATSRSFYCKFYTGKLHLNLGEQRS